MIWVSVKECLRRGGHEHSLVTWRRDSWSAVWCLHLDLISILLTESLISDITRSGGRGMGWSLVYVEQVRRHSQPWWRGGCWWSVANNHKPSLSPQLTGATSQFTGGLGCHKSGLLWPPDVELNTIDFPFIFSNDSKQWMTRCPGNVKTLDTILYFQSGNIPHPPLIGFLAVSSDCSSLLSQYLLYTSSILLWFPHCHIKWILRKWEGTK